MDVSTLSVPVNLLKPTLLPSAYTSQSSAPSGAASTASSGTRAKIDATAKQFESQFLSVMLGQMFQGVKTSAPFGGGEGEDAFKSFLTDAFAKEVTHHGGIGLAKNISKEMLKLQGLS
jgi:flagellar protein FlgJ